MTAYADLLSSDVAQYNILMDARPLIPKGWHPSAPYLQPNGRALVEVKSRSSVATRIKYYLIDFEHAHAASAAVVWMRGQDQSVPEQQNPGKPWDLLPVDIYTLGNMLRINLLEVCLHQFHVDSEVKLDSWRDADIYWS